MAVAMRALDAVIVTLQPGGDRRRIAIGDFYRLPGDTPQIETVVQPGELITHVELPPVPVGTQLYRKVRDRASYAFALVSVAGIISVEDGKIASAALAFGGLGPMPWRDPAVEAALIGQEPVDCRVRGGRGCAAGRCEGLRVERLQDPPHPPHADRLPARPDRDEPGQCPEDGPPGPGQPARPRRAGADRRPASTGPRASSRSRARRPIRPNIIMPGSAYGYLVGAPFARGKVTGSTTRRPGRCRA